jgi:uncharacterized membrane protein
MFYRNIVMPDETTKTTVPAKVRYNFIDVFRGISVIFMIEAHLLDALVYPPNKTGFLYSFLNLYNGFISVSFLFCAGAAFWIASMRKLDDYSHFRKPIFVYLKRLGFVLALAYWLHLPYPSLPRMLNISWQGFLGFVQVDILHTIVASSLIALVVLLIVPKPKYLPYIYLFLAALVFYSTPFVWQYDAISNLPPVISSYAARQFISKFPLFPWSGYFFIGITASSIFSNAVDKNKTMKLMLIAGLALLAIDLLITQLPITYPGLNDWWYTSPGHSWFRVSIPIILFSILFLIEKKIAGSTIFEFLRLSGQESLFIYVGHLVIVYGSVVSIGLKTIIGPRLNLLEMFIVVIAIAVAFYALAYVWNNTKKQAPRRAAIITITLSVLFLVIFVLNPL